MSNVHVGIQLRSREAELVRADAEEACWEVEVEVVAHEPGVDFRGPAVQGKRGDRFIYLTWGDVDVAGHFERFRRAKLMLDRIPGDVVTAAMEGEGLHADVELTDELGCPRCARVDPPAISWSVIEPR